MNRLKVCYFIKRYPRLSETFIVNEIRELQRQGIDVTIVAKGDAGEELVHENAQRLRVPIYYLPPKSSLPRKLWSIQSLASLSAQPRQLGFNDVKGPLSAEDRTTLIQTALVVPLLMSLGINHIHAHFATWATTAASFASKMTGIPYSFTAHAKDIYHESVNRTALAEKITQARFVMTVSDYNKRYLQTLLCAEGHSGHLVRLYNGIDLHQFTPAAKRAAPHLLVSIGRLVQKKGFTHLIDACHLLKKKGRRVRCLIVGEGEERHALEQQIAQHALEKEVTLVGAKTQAEVLELLRRAAVFVLPCVIGDDGNRDGLPTVLLEAMALGVPAISTHVTGIPEIITNGRTGLLVKGKSPLPLAQAIATLLDSEPLRKRLSRAAQVKVRQDFNLAKNVRILKEFFLS